MDKKDRIGDYVKGSAVAGESYRAYVPKSLPPEPAVEINNLYPLLDQANAALGRLDAMSMMLPDVSLFLYMYIRKEAVFSSQIEGTQSSLSDLLLFENYETPGVPINDVTEVSNYVSAMNYGLERLKDFPLSLRLIREIHGILLKDSRGGHKSLGEFRHSQNWVGGTRPGNAIFVPPPAENLMDCLSDFEKFLHDEKNKLPVLVKAALAHVQFETIHPFLDGNGRLGRLLITFILCVEGILQKPLLYLSLYLKTNRQAYYEHLQSVRETGDWEAWIEFFLKGVIETSHQATKAARDILDLFERDRLKISESNKSKSTTLVIHSFFQRNPISNTSKIEDTCKITLPTVLRNLGNLEELGIIKEITGKDRHKIFVYKEYLDLLNQGTELRS
jgi:Fic family protein